MDAETRAAVAAALKKERSDLARRGGLARAESLTAQRRKSIATKASKAAAAARKKAKKKPK